MGRLALCVLCLLLAGAAVAQSVSKQSRPTESRPAVREERRETQAFVQRVNSMDELKAMTPEDRARAKPFDAIGGRRLVAGDDVSRIVDRGLYWLPFGGTPTYSHVLEKLACSAPLIVVGRSTPRRVRMNDPGTFLFTEHVVAVTRWILQDAAVPSSGVLEFLTAGGEVAIGNDRIVTRSGTRLVRDTDYLLFLKTVPNSKSFTLAQEPIPSQPQWDLVLPFAALPPELKMNEVTFETFVEDLQLAVLACAGPK
jgi:hypothetical protein